jgi:Leucine-rich repeat (LRR) protein
LLLNKNQLVQLSPDFRKLTGLEKLELKNNQLKDVSEICSLCNLAELNISGNPISKLPVNKRILTFFLFLVRFEWMHNVANIGLESL